MPICVCGCGRNTTTSIYADYSCRKRAKRKATPRPSGPSAPTPVKKGSEWTREDTEQDVRAGLCGCGCRVPLLATKSRSSDSRFIHPVHRRIAENRWAGREGAHRNTVKFRETPVEQRPVVYTRNFRTFTREAADAQIAKGLCGCGCGETPPDGAQYLTITHRDAAKKRRQKNRLLREGMTE